jgi:hypothetical protein
LTTIIAAREQSGRKVDLVLADLERIRGSILRPEAVTAAENADIAIAARELQSRLTAMDLFGWVDDAALIAAMAEARSGPEPARRAATELREIAERFERNGSATLAAQTRLDAADAWILADDPEAARADALEAKRLAYGDGPPYTLKLFEDRAELLLARL